MKKILPPHITLGITKTSDPESIKSAFRALVKRFHPDLHPNNPIATLRFQRIVEAYEIMMSERSLVNKEKCPRAIIYTTTISFLESVHGCSRSFKLHNGKNIQFHIPSGIIDGECLNLAKDNTQNDGNIMLTVYVEPHHLFTRNGKDIYLTMSISLRDAILGAEATIPTIFGNTNVYIHPGTNSDTVIRIPKKGIHNGDQYVTIKVMIPKNPDPSLITFMQTWKE